MQIINTVAEVFKVEKEEFESIKAFVISNDMGQLDNSNILVISDKKRSSELCQENTHKTASG